MGRRLRSGFSHVGEHVSGPRFVWHPRFNTARSPVGDLLYRLKYRNDQAVIEELVEAIMMLWEKWKPPIDAIIPVPPSNVNRKSQPVIVVATALADWLHVPVCTECLRKTKRTAQLKDVFEYDKRREALKPPLPFRRCLYRSRATVTVITELLKSEGKANAVYLLTLTETRRMA